MEICFQGHLRQLEKLDRRSCQGKIKNDHAKEGLIFQASAEHAQQRFGNVPALLCPVPIGLAHDVASRSNISR